MLGSIEKSFSPNDTEEMLNALVENDQQLYVNLEYSRKLFDEIVSSGRSFSPEALNGFIELQNSYKERQSALKNSKAIKTKNWVGDKISRFKSWLGLGGLGAIPIIPVAIGGIALVGASIILYYTFGPRYTKSTQDLKISDDLKLALSMVSPEMAERIKADLESQVDTAFVTGKNRGAIDSLLNTGKWVLIGGFSIWAFLKFFPLISQSVEQTKSKLITE